MRKTRKIWITIAASLLLLLATPTATAQGEARRNYTPERPLIYEDAWDLWPYVFLTDEGVPAGYNVDMLKIIFEELEIPYEIHLKPTGEALEDLKKGKSDLMLGMVANFHDDYTTHYGKNVIHLFTHSIAHPINQQPTVHSLADLVSQKVIVHTGSFSHHLMQDHGWDDNATGYEDMDKAIQMVSAEGQGQVLWNTMSLKWLIKKFHVDNLKLSPVDMPSGDYRFMANDSRLLDLLDNAYTKLAADGTLQPLEIKWFHPEQKEEKNIPQWIWYIAAAVALATSMLIAISLIYHLRARKATREGRIRNARLEQILKNCQVRIWTYDLRTKVFTWYGDTKHTEQRYSTEEFSQRYTPEDFERLMEGVRQIANQNQDEVRLNLKATDTPDGQVHAYRVNLSVLHTERGRPRIIIGTKADVTEEHRKQQHNTELTSRYQGIFTTAMVDMVYFDKEGYVKNMNQRAEQTFGMTLADMIREGVSLTKALGSDVIDFNNIDKTYVSMVLSPDNANLGITRHYEPGTNYYEMQLVPIFDSEHNHLGTYGTGRIITEFVRNYHAAHQNVERLRKATQAVSDHVNNINFALQVGGVRQVSYSPVTHLLTINHRIHEAQYVLTQQRCLQLVELSSMDKVMSLFRALDRMANRPMTCDVRTKLRIGSDKWLNLTLQLFPKLDTEGHVTEYTGICRDTTELKYTERMLQQETDKAQEVEQVKNKFLHNMCHEIRTPLNTVVKYAEMFEQEHTREEEEFFTEQIKENSAFLLNLINDILFLSRLDANMVEITPQPCDFAQTFEGHCQMGWANKKQEGVSFIVENHFNQLIVNIDDSNLGRVIEQVTANAAEHTTSGYVHTRYEYIGGKLIIFVADTGAGIAPDTLSHIFERFNVSSTKTHGTGLSLPICKELMRQLGGTIDISSELGKGTSVWISLPCSATIIDRKKEV